LRFWPWKGARDSLSIPAVEAKQTFGRNVRRHRMAAGLTQQELGERSELDHAEISRLERGLRDPQLATMVKLARGLRIQAKELLEGI
jgi:transcriptional regulator with XRE-family HTH domain